MKKDKKKIQKMGKIEMKIKMSSKASLADMI